MGVLTGTALAAMLMGKLFSVGVRESPLVRDKLRSLLDSIDGYPVVFCRTCSSFVSTAPREAIDDCPDCLANDVCLIRRVALWGGDVVERSGPLCSRCDELRAYASEQGELANGPS